ncbi:hypothetical protein DVH05_027126 [Phytophthora capsici]|nr:hypothetical protein DVH05_027126 [Phytophthora capsici]
MKFFSSVFAVSLLVASALTVDAGATTQVSDNCGTGFSQTGGSSKSNGKHGVPITKSGFSQTGSSATEGNPNQDSPDQNNPGQTTPDQNNSSDGSGGQIPPVLKGDCLLTGDYINNTDVRNCHNIIVDNLRVPAGVTLNFTKIQDNATVSFRGVTTFGQMVRQSNDLCCILLTNYHLVAL